MQQKRSSLEQAQEKLVLWEVEALREIQTASIPGLEKMMEYLPLAPDRVTDHLACRGAQRLEQLKEQPAFRDKVDVTTMDLIPASISTKEHKLAWEIYLRLRPRDCPDRNWDNVENASEEVMDWRLRTAFEEVPIRDWIAAALDHPSRFVANLKMAVSHFRKNYKGLRDSNFSGLRLHPLTSWITRNSEASLSEFMKEPLSMIRFCIVQASTLRNLIDRLRLLSIRLQLIHENPHSQDNWRCFEDKELLAIVFKNCRSWPLIRQIGLLKKYAKLLTEKDIERFISLSPSQLSNLCETRQDLYQNWFRLRNQALQCLIFDSRNFDYLQFITKVRLTYAFMQNALMKYRHSTKETTFTRPRR